MSELNQGIREAWMEAHDERCILRAALNAIVEQEGHPLGSLEHDIRIRELKAAGRAWLTGFEMRRPELEAEVREVARLEAAERRRAAS